MLFCLLFHFSSNLTETMDICQLLKKSLDSVQYSLTILQKAPMFFGLVQGFSKKEKWAFCPVPNGNSLKTLERKLLIIKSFTKHKCPLVNMNINQEHSRTVIVCCYQPLDSTSPVYILTCGIRRTLKNNLFLRARITQLKTQKDRFFFFTDEVVGPFSIYQS